MWSNADSEFVIRIEKLQLNVQFDARVYKAVHQLSLTVFHILNLQFLKAAIVLTKGVEVYRVSQERK